MKQQPNIILLFSDQHRWDWLSCESNKNVYTPNLDKLARNGVKFTNTYCPSPLCGPSRMGMLASRHPHSLGIYTNEHSLRSDIPTFVHSLSMAGYETVLCGRMHFSGEDQSHGYEKRIYDDLAGHYPGEPMPQYGKFQGAQIGGKISCKLTGIGDNPILEYDADVTGHCVKFLDERNTKDDNKPLFLTVGFLSPHSPYAAPREYYDRAYKRMQENDALLCEETMIEHPWIRKYMDNFEFSDVTDEEKIRTRVSYAAMIDYMDEQFGRIIEKAKMLPGETYVVYISDHGDMIGDKGMFGKKCFFDPSIKVPMIIAPLDKDENAIGIASDRTVDIPVSLLDLGPTLISFTDAPKLPNAVGIDISSLLKDETNQKSYDNLCNRPVFADQHIGWTGACRMVRVGKYKLMYFYDYEEVLLFNLDEDADENNNLGSKKEYKEIIENLKEKLFEDWNPDEMDKDYRTTITNVSFLSKWGREIKSLDSYGLY